MLDMWFPLEPRKPHLSLSSTTDLLGNLGQSHPAPASFGLCSEPLKKDLLQPLCSRPQGNKRAQG